MPENNNPFEELASSQKFLKVPNHDMTLVLAQNYSELAFALLEMVKELGPMLSDAETEKEHFIAKWNENLEWIEALCNIHAQSIIEMT